LSGKHNPTEIPKKPRFDGRGRIWLVTTLTKYPERREASAGRYREVQTTYAFSFRLLAQPRLTNTI
jgi:hypothetical protein